MNKCNKCNLVKPVSNFHKNVKNICKICSLEKAKIYRLKNRDKINEKQNSNYNENIKISREKQNKYRVENYEKRKALEDKTRIKHREKRRYLYKKYYNENKEKVLNIIKKSQRKRRKKINLYNNRINKEKRKNDPGFKIKQNYRSRLHQFLKYKKQFNKQTSTAISLGCSPNELKLHLESQFSEGMTWDNYGQYGWHIDHIIPLASASTQREFEKLCHHTNLQPLWAIDNLKKGSKIIPQE